MSRVVLVPGVLALLPEYARREDPVADLRAACLAAVAWLGPGPRIVADEQGLRVARVLVAGAAAVSASAIASGETARSREPVSDSAIAPVDTAQNRPPVSNDAIALVETGPDPGRSVLVVGNGSATRSEKAPGHLDPRAHEYDDALRRALTRPDPAALRELDQRLGAELWAGVGCLADLGGLLTPAHRAQVDYDDDPYGVQYWVIRWERSQR